jgi:hypothetical protein
VHRRIFTALLPIASEVEDSPGVPAVQQFCDPKVHESRFKIYCDDFAVSAIPDSGPARAVL